MVYYVHVICITNYTAQHIVYGIIFLLHAQYETGIINELMKDLSRLRDIHSRVYL